MAKSVATRKQGPPARKSSVMGPRLCYALLLVMPWAAYLPLHAAGFIWDDDFYVLNNSTLRSLDGLRQMWLVPRSLPQYYPLVHTMFWIEYHLWDLHPLGYHAVNVLLHGVSAVLLWRLLVRLEVPGAWLAAAIFAVHPVMVESVAWITERKNVLSLPLALGSALCYLRFAPFDEVSRTPVDALPRHYYVLSLLLFVAALLSKTVVFSLPAVLLVIYWWKRGTLAWSDVRPLLPFFVLGILGGGTTAWLEKHHVGAAGAEWSLSPIERVLVAGQAVWFYAAKLVWPHPLVFFYPRWEIDEQVWWQYLYPLSALAALVGMWLAQHRLGRGPLAAALIFVGVLTPALGFFDVYPFRYSFVADHFQYHASVALIALGSAAVTLIAAKAQGALTPGIRVALVAVLLATLGGLTFQQSHVYRNLETLYRDILAKNPTSWNTYVNLANHLSEVRRYDEAFSVMREGLQARPDIAEVHSHYGAYLVLVGQRDGLTRQLLDEAIEHYRLALRLRPSLNEVNVNLASALCLSDRHAEAIPYFARALEVDPDDTEAAFAMGKAHFDLANKLMGKKEFEQAAEHYTKAARLRPDSAQSLNNLGIARMNLGQIDAAIRSFEESLRVDPDFEQAKSNLQRAREEAQAAEDHDSDR